MREKNAAVQTNDNCNCWDLTNRLMEEIASGCIHHASTTQVGHDHDTLEPKHKHKTNTTQVEMTENAAEQCCRAKATGQGYRAQPQSKQHDAHKTESTMKRNKLAQWTINDASAHECCTSPHLTCNCNQHRSRWWTTIQGTNRASAQAAQNAIDFTID